MMKGKAYCPQIRVEMVMMVKSLILSGLMENLGRYFQSAPILFVPAKVRPIIKNFTPNRGEKNVLG
ncbi:hypothetical protein J5I95_13275 [Candidatus Poribacteria bacterium]|nr:hypothetical protein [Candidatus Poribacteria bacterium]